MWPIASHFIKNPPIWHNKHRENIPGKGLRFQIINTILKKFRCWKGFAFYSKSRWFPLMWINLNAIFQCWISGAMQTIFSHSLHYKIMLIHFCKWFFSLRIILLRLNKYSEAHICLLPRTPSTGWTIARYNSTAEALRNEQHNVH